MPGAAQEVADAHHKELFAWASFGFKGGEGHYLLQTLCPCSVLKASAEV